MKAIHHIGHKIFHILSTKQTELDNKQTLLVIANFVTKLGPTHHKVGSKPFFIKRMFLKKLEPTDSNSHQYTYLICLFVRLFN